ncbi:MAG: cupin domain-containing protein [Opitutales bacterium]
MRVPTPSCNRALNNLTVISRLLIFAFIMNDALSPKAHAADSTPASPTQPAAGKMASQVFLWESLKFVPSKTGARVTVFDEPTPTLDRFHCHITTLNPGENTGPLHRHPQEEFIVIKEGMLEINIDGKKQIATPGSMIFYAANENENMTNVGKTPATYYVIQFYTALTPKS